MPGGASHGGMAIALLTKASNLRLETEGRLVVQGTSSSHQPEMRGSSSCKEQKKGTHSWVDTSFYLEDTDGWGAQGGSDKDLGSWVDTSSEDEDTDSIQEKGLSHQAAVLEWATTYEHGDYVRAALAEMRCSDLC